MGVQEELEALRQQGVTKTHASALAQKGGRALSTPQAEEEALKAEQERLRKTNYGKDADENLKSFNEAKALKSGKSGTKVTAESLLGAAAGAAGADAGEDKDEANDDAATEAPIEMKAETLEEDSDDDEDVPDLEEQDGVGATMEGADPSRSRQLNRAEKKARKMMQRLNMRPVSDISRVTFKPRGGGYFAIDSPDVYEKNGSYVIFGEAYHGGQQQAAMQQAAMQQAKAAAALQDKDGSGDVPTLDDDADEAVDDSGVEAKDIGLVMSQASCSRAKAVAALKENDGDLVNAIMSLTT